MTRILILEDHDVFRNTLQATLTSANYETAAASNIHELAVIVADWPPDIAIVDWLLGNEKTGADVTGELRRQFPRLRTILITGYPVEYAKQRPDAAIDALIAKPFSSQVLLDTVAQIRAKQVEG